jgi:hypothetical protein
MIYWVKETVYILRLYGEKIVMCSLFRLNCVKNFKFVLQTSSVNETAIKHICVAHPVLVVQGLLFYMGESKSILCLQILTNSGG